MDEWNAIVVSGVGPSITYLFSRLNDRGGDCFDLAEFYRVARIFNPKYAASISYNEGLELMQSCVKHCNSLLALPNVWPS